jgi:hypothetical protein
MMSATSLVTIFITSMGHRIHIVTHAINRLQTATAFLCHIRLFEIHESRFRMFLKTDSHIVYQASEKSLREKHKSLIPHTLNQLKWASQSHPDQSTNSKHANPYHNPLTDDVESQARQVSGTWEPSYQAPRQSSQDPQPRA